MAAASRRSIAMALTAAAVVFLDRATKAWAVANLDGRSPLRLFGGALELALAENSGGFLSVGGRLSPAARCALFVVAVGAGLAAGSIWLVRSRSLSIPRSLAAAAVIGGGASNLVDRFRHARVVDFAVLRAGPLHTGVFNLADAAILGGAILFAWPAFGRRMEARDDPPAVDGSSNGGIS